MSSPPIGTTLSEMPVKPTPSGAELVPIYDPNEPNIALRNKTVPVTALYGQDGATGATGQSAYQLWLAQGNSGTEQQFLASLQGTAGSTWYEGNGIPSPSTGNNGDYYVDTATGNVYKKVSSSWGSPLFSIKGTAGSTWYQGSSIPSSGLGIDGDYYVQTTTGNVYNKVSGSWGSPLFSQIGPQGTPGTNGTNGTDGADGQSAYQLWVDQGYSVGGDTSQTAFLHWLQGAPGSVWYQGAAVPSNSTGINGDYYFRTTTGDIYTKQTGAWGSPIGNITGPQGVQGNMFRVGSGIPSSGLGSNGDYYLDEISGLVYGPKASGAWGSSTGRMLTAETYTAKTFNATTSFAAYSNTNIVYILPCYGNRAASGENQELTDTSISTTLSAPYAGKIKMPVTSTQPLGARNPGSDAITGFTDLIEFNTTTPSSAWAYVQRETMLSGYAKTFAAAHNASLGFVPNIITFTAAPPTGAWGAIKEGSTAWNNLLQNITQIIALVQANGQIPIIPGFFFSHREPTSSNTSTDQGNGNENYLKCLEQLKWLMSDLRLMTGQNKDPLLLVEQTNDPVGRTPLQFDDSIADFVDLPKLGQLAAASKIPGVIFTGPHYDASVYPTYSNNVLASKGSLIMGLRIGNILAEAYMGTSYEAPHWDEAETCWIDSRTIRLAYNLPRFHSGTGTPDYTIDSLVIDTGGTPIRVAHLSDSGLYGFAAFLNNRSGQPLGITSISIVQQGQSYLSQRFLDIQFDRKPAGSVLLTYAMQCDLIQGVQSLSITLPAGSSGTDGTYNLAFSGTVTWDAGNTPAGTFTVSGGQVVSYVITAKGATYDTNPTPNVSFSACPGLTGATATPVMGYLLSSGPYYGSRGCIRAADNSLSTVISAVTTYAYKWAASQYQYLPPPPDEQYNLIQNADGGSNSNGVNQITDGGIGQDSWYGLIQATSYEINLTTVKMGTYIGNSIRIMHNDPSSTRIGYMQVISQPASQNNRLLTMNLNGYVHRPNNGGGRIQVTVLSWTSTPGSIPIDIVNNWASSNFTSTDGSGFYINNANLTSLTSLIIDPGTTITRIQAPPFMVPSNCNNLIVFTSVVDALVGNTSTDPGSGSGGYGNPGDPVSDPYDFKLKLEYGAFMTGFIPSEAIPSKKQAILFVCSDEVTPLATTTTTTRYVFRMPYAFSVTGVKASLHKAQTSGAKLQVDILNGVTSMFSTPLTFENGQLTTKTATVPFVLTNTPLSVNDDNQIAVNVTVDAGGSQDATGLKIYLIGYSTF